MRSYHLCREIAVAFDGKIYRATDAEIEAALRNETGAPSTDAATFVKAVQKAYRQYLIVRACPNGSG